MMDQITYLHWAIGQAKYYDPVIPSTRARGPYPRTPARSHHEADSPGEAAREGIGYDGGDRDPPRHLFAHQDGAAVVTAPAPRVHSASTSTQDDGLVDEPHMRARKEPPSKGGWNIRHSWIDAVDAMNPVVNPLVW